MRILSEFAAHTLEAALYPDIPELGGPVPEKKKLVSHVPPHLNVKLDDPFDEISMEDLKPLSIRECYELLEYFEAQKGPIQAIRESIRGQIAFVRNIVHAIEGIKKEDTPLEQRQKHIMACEKALLADLEADGLNVRYSSDLSPEDINQKPALILTTHQGGGGENYIHQALTGIPGRLVVKSELMRIPYIKEGLRASQAIPVNRRELKNPERRKEEINKVAKEVAEELAKGGNVYVFIEGTRSRDGEIAATEKRRQWAEDFLAEVEKQAHRVDFQKLLLVVHTMTAMPDAPEEKVFGTRFRTGGTSLSACLMRADHFTDLDAKDPYNQTTLFGTARVALKNMLVEAILECQNSD